MAPQRPDPVILVAIGIMSAIAVVVVVALIVAGVA